MYSHSLLSFSRRLAFLILILGTLPRPAAGGSGKLTGRVTEQDAREPIPGAHVIVTHEIVGESREIPLDRPAGAAVDADGYYVILNLAPGVYVVRASAVGYTPIIQRMVKVESDRTVSLNFQLRQSAVEMEPVVVTAMQAPIKPDVSATQEVIGTMRIEQMPVIRVDEFVTKLKGVELVSGAEGNGLSVRGGAIRETDVRLDGMSLQDPRSENSYLALNSTAIKEIQVVTGGFEAKYGGIRSGLLNVITSDGHREKYTFAAKADVAPAHQPKYFGTDPYSASSWIYRVFAGEYAMKGVPSGDTTVPIELRNFKGWNPSNPRNRAGDRRLDSLQNLDLWLRQHPQYEYGNKVDLYLEGSLTGPFPGADLPLIGGYAEQTTFLLAYKYENSQLAFPLGPRRDYIDWNAQLKLTTAISENMRLAVNGMYANVSTVSGGQTTSYGGALVDQSSSFGFLNNNEASLRSQARLLSGDNFWNIFNLSRSQFFDQRYIVGGARLTHTISPTAYHTIDLQFGYTDQDLRPYSLDTSRADAWITYQTPSGPVRYLNAPEMGTPNGSTNPGYDVLNMWRLYGGMQRIDSSYSWAAQLKWDYTGQFGRHHQIGAGFSARYQNMFVYTGTWLQAQIAFTPDLWQYYTATPLEMALYLQDKLEFEGMILNLGVRLDYFNPMRPGFQVGIPPDEDYANFYNVVYQNLPGPWGGYERWLAFRDMLDSPPGWPTTENEVQFRASPRLGVSFPVTESSKLYFNYGHFYQRPASSFLYNQVNDIASVAVPSPELAMGRTISYEFGYEQLLFSEILFNVTAYYKDVSNEPLSRQFINYYHDNMVRQYFPDRYGDSRGVELRLERPLGRFLTFQAMYDYLIQSWGQSGLARVYENRLEAVDELRSANITTTDPRPRANIALHLHTPAGFGGEFLGIHWLDRWLVTFLFEWRDGGRFLWNPDEQDVKKQIYVDRVDFHNIDLRVSKAFDLWPFTMELVLTVKNLTNNKYLVPENMLRTQYDAYKASLRLPHQGGSDQWGQWKSDDGHINTGWWEAPIFLNPRRILLGLRVNL